MENLKTLAYESNSAIQLLKASHLSTGANWATAPCLFIGARLLITPRLLYTHG